MSLRAPHTDRFIAILLIYLRIKQNGCKINYECFTNYNRKSLK